MYNFSNHKPRFTHHRSSCSGQQFEDLMMSWPTDMEYDGMPTRNPQRYLAAETLDAVVTNQPHSIIANETATIPTHMTTTVPIYVNTTDPAQATTMNTTRMTTTVPIYVNTTNPAQATTRNTTRITTTTPTYMNTTTPAQVTTRTTTRMTTTPTHMTTTTILPEASQTREEETSDEINPNTTHDDEVRSRDKTAKLSRKRSKIAEIMRKLNLQGDKSCRDSELKAAVESVINSKEVKTDFITVLFFPNILTEILCKTTNDLNYGSLEKSGETLVNELKQLLRKFGMNDHRRTLIRIMLGIMKKRAIIRFPYHNMEITIFINVLNSRLPKSIKPANQLREKLAVLVGMKNLLSKLRGGIWASSLRSQRRDFRDVEKEIGNIMDATMEDSSWEGQEELENLELQMMASFQEVSIEEMDMSLFMEMLSGFK